METGTTTCDLAVQDKLDPATHRSGPPSSNKTRRGRRPETAEVALIQCFQCCRFGHRSGECRAAVRCNRCGGPHRHMHCTTPRESPVCVLCKGPHAASYQGCPYRQRILRNIAATQRPKGGKLEHSPPLVEKPRQRWRHEAVQSKIDLLDILKLLLQDNNQRPYWNEPRPQWQPKTKKHHRPRKSAPDRRQPTDITGEDTPASQTRTPGNQETPDNSHESSAQATTNN